MFMKSAWAALLTNQIQLFLANKTQNEKVKAELKSQTTLLMGTLIQKTLRQKTHEYFKHLRTQGVNKLKITRFKGTFMMGRISNLYHLKTKLGFEQLQGQCLKGRQKF